MLLIGGVLVVIVWALAAGLTMLRGYLHARDAVNRLEAAREQLSPEDLLRGEGRDELEAALREFEDAHDRGSSPLLWPLRPLPIIGRQVNAFASMADATTSMLEAGIVGIERVNREVPVDAEIPSEERADVLRTVASIAESLDAEVTTADLGPSEGLARPLANARRRLQTELDGLHAGLARGIGAATGAADILGSDGSYLVLITNNAEMRAGSGMILRVGRLDVRNGSVSLDDLQSAGAPLEEAVEADAELLENWGWLEPAQRFQNAGVTPRFDVVAPVAEGIWLAKGGAPVDGVIALDVLALRSLLEVTGPILVDGREIDAGNVEQEIFIEQYAEGVDQEERLGDIAEGVIDALDGGDWELATMAEQLRIAANGRHLLVWSPDATPERAWEEARVSGTLGPDSLLVSLLNLGGNKLDQFADVDAALSVNDVDDGWLVTVDLVVRNVAPDDAPDVVLGPFEGSGLGRGEYAGVVTAHVPGDAESVGLDGGDRGLVRSSDGASDLVGSSVRLAPGAERELRLQVVLPEDRRMLVVEPSARVPAIRWTADDLEWEDDTPQILRW